MLIFISIAVASFIIVAGSLLFGHDHDAGHDGDGGHDVDGGDSEPTVSLFSPKVIGTLLMGFGAAGAIAQYYHLSYLFSSLVGLGCGLLLAAAMYLVLGVFYKQQASSLVATSSTIGTVGRVTTTIVEGGQGEVSLQVDGQYTTYSATSQDGRPINKGQSVRVVRTLGSQLIVDKE